LAFGRSQARRIRPVIQLLKRLLARFRPKANPPSTIEDRLLIAKSGLFDAAAYLSDWPEAAGPGGDPITHYLREGWRKGANPGAGFDARYYLFANDDVRKSGQNPLVHYLRHGNGEGRLPLPPDGPMPGGGSLPLRKPKVPSPDDWTRLSVARDGPSTPPVVDVVIPVHGAFEEVMACLYSVLTSRNTTPYQLIVIDDCSPQAELRGALDRLAACNNIELHRTPRNIGFAGACNMGMALHPERDVLLLNSDTEVFGNWIDRLRIAAYRRGRTGTVTPLCNNAEICSYPHFMRNYRWELEVPDSVLDELAARVNGGQEVEIPTGVGFCMYLRRDCLGDVGLFDTARFGLGYGEENDLCRRAAAAGWRNILAPNVFVRHFGAASFSHSKAVRVRNALQIVERRHPGYLSLVGAFVKQDPIRPYREAIDVARLGKRGRVGTILFITHSLGGGTERHVRELAELLENSGTPVLFCCVDRENSSHIRIENAKMGGVPNLPKFDINRDLCKFGEFLCSIGVVHIHIHHLAGFAENMADFVRLMCAGSGISYDMTLHDYMVICPRINLVDSRDRYCGEPELQSCENCIQSHGSPFGHPAVWEWRDRHSRLLAGARLVFVPNEDVKDRIERYFSNLSIVVRPHLEIPIQQTKTSRFPGTFPAKNDKRRVIVVGAIGLAKGSRLLQQTAAAASMLKLPLEFVVIGYTDRNSELSAIGNVTITGKYEEDEVIGILTSAEADLAWFPAVWPETYSYTLSAVFAAGLFPVAFDFGAIANRIRAAEWGELLPLSYMSGPPLLAQRLSEVIIPAAKLRGSTICPRSYPIPLQSYYAVNDALPGSQGQTRFIAR
jgi:GT2 family glycosyltransferase/glycosyltransferase involved in cell wall biosynthesis